MKKKHKRILDQISASIPKELTDNLIIQEAQCPYSLQIMERALEDPEVSKEDKERFMSIIDSGMLQKVVDVVDPKVEKKIDEYMEKEIEKAIKLGRLPKEDKAYIKKVKKLNKKYEKNIQGS